ncbi:unnamed protein product [Rotaria sp. Silwood2]|nr:unnamed protein product [Rotaria sp. Silwood2]
MGTSFTAFRAMFYLLLPSETYYERPEDVPDYVVKVIQLFFLLQTLELVIAIYRGKAIPRFNDTFSSVTAGVMSRIPRLFLRSIELSTYIWVYENVRIFPRLPWNSPITY